MVSNKFPCDENGFKYFLGFRCGEILIPLCIKPRQMSGYVKSFDETRYILFLIKDKQL